MVCKLLGDLLHEKLIERNSHTATCYIIIMLKLSLVVKLEYFCLPDGVPLLTSLAICDVMNFCIKWNEQHLNQRSTKSQLFISK